MSFQISYVGGGTLDRVKELPYPHFSKFTKPYIKGNKVEVLAENRVFTGVYSLPFPTEFLSVAFACSQYCIGDYWELTIGGEKVCEQIYTKELPESVSMGNSFGIVYPLPENTPITFEFHNRSAQAKTVWYNIKLLRP
ncbi:hypothetical protein NQ117_09525 [Paenibacillus sp. SC116]|uniref:hypothetical protein n=1 Tax=Paenibacillus sp. SC116 TaxID=2968986 RepID=UPI00215A3635|nr:hypothetical protein [Paenibacillus sp. SC116]MCR8843927.1 hypothetical protein [Paenibacillus sp. SC116]